MCLSSSRKTACANALQTFFQSEIFLPMESIEIVSDNAKISCNCNSSTNSCTTTFDQRQETQHARNRNKEAALPNFKTTDYELNFRATQQRWLRSLNHEHHNRTECRVTKHRLDDGPNTKKTNTTDSLQSLQDRWEYASFRDRSACLEHILSDVLDLRKADDVRQSRMVVGRMMIAR